MFDKGVTGGSATSYTRLFRLSEGQIVYSKLFGWEGAVALVPAEFDGYFVSSEFPTFAPDPVRVAPGFLEHFLKSNQFTEEMARSTNGLGQRRQRVNIDAFLRILVPLPPTSEQDRIAAHLTELAEGAVHSGDRPKASVDALVSLWLDSLPQRPLGHLAEVGPRPLRLAPDSPIDFVPMEAVDAITGSIVGSQQRARSDLASGYRQFQAGDVIFARITPSMQNGKSAVYEGYNARVGYGSTEFHVLRPHDDRYTRWIWALLRTQWFISRARESFTGTAGQQRVPASFLEQVKVPTPTPAQLPGAIERLIDVRARMNEVRRVALHRDELAKSILPAARNEIFSALR
ncbi:hypothetical protein G7070_08260 [Propioniciclava coleopterorum]|uniref:Type I restriction enzyme, S subunit n=1 Tax=Propioniciclava coleopterorum TaxID=2714937 RepID=A0A6G7Y629_9ACTN|nr:hypothetical protein [Propioniciclava coleopterorum]QIK72265.1 hypothetical protein G7070_08260 [Propioniciclava coleopterorum]